MLITSWTSFLNSTFDVVIKRPKYWGKRSSTSPTSVAFNSIQATQAGQHW